MTVTLSAKLGSDVLTVTAFDGKQVALVSPRPFAPGYRLALDVAFQTPALLELKTLGSKKRADGAFDVRARPMTLRKDVREKLFAHFGGA